ncbi:signal recognition particle [Micromonospora hortensis]|uniref:pPIWI_RE_Z domain-containing protein n=1 Tax=Micromonospora hortensis TaxID=2911209 RepID=UPI001EE99080|nr:signal recognition particle [Micromonospora hortensis]MCG5450968.1 signal recognition particle [Micromonospora hortensis]
MRDRSSWHGELASEFRGAWKAPAGFGVGDLLDVELAIYLGTRVMPTRPVRDVWTLLSGYPYEEAFGDVRTSDARLMIRRARHFLWDRSRRYTWHNSLHMYLDVGITLRGYTFATIDDLPEALEPTRAHDRREVYERLLTQPPPLERRELPIAGAGHQLFYVRDQRHSVNIPADLIGLKPWIGHDTRAVPAGKGEPITVTMTELEAAAGAMDALEVAANAADLAEDRTPGKSNDWKKRLRRVELLLRDEAAGAFQPHPQLRIDRLMNLVGMVGAGKSTIRDILAFQLATREQPADRRRTTIVVGDVAEVLTITEQFRRLGVHAAPILGKSTLERNIQRLHRRSESATQTMLNHDNPGFAHLSSACPLDALRGFEARRALAITAAPCTGLYSADDVEKAEIEHDDPDAAIAGFRRRRKPARPKRHGCPLWTACPRHSAARDLVDAQIWVATPASLVHSRVPDHLNDENMRYLELACRRSDLIIVDEADRVQMQLDTAFAPAATLVARGAESWLDEIGKHKLTELAAQGRLQLSSDETDDWNSALNTVITATDRIYSMLINDEPLRRWITQDYFSAMTLHQWLINEWFPELRRRNRNDDENAEAPNEDKLAPQRAGLQRVDAVLGSFRDSPLTPLRGRGPEDATTDLVNALVAMATELLHAPRGVFVREFSRERLKKLLRQLVPNNASVAGDLDANLHRFEFTLVLAVLHDRLDRMTILWPRVEAALNLDSTSNVLSRRPPKDYMPVVPESPMGNVLGFQFQAGDRNEDGDQSGELRFFRCNGVGRELLLELADIPAVDNRPGPHVLLMSATSWAGTSSRYHLHAQVDAVLRPHEHEVAAIKKSTFRKLFLYPPGITTALRLSGTDPRQRPAQLEQMLHQLAVPDRSLTGATSLLQQELDDIDDPQRRRILLLVGSYAEAQRAGHYLNNLPEWTGNVTVLVSDDTDLDHSWSNLPADTRQLHLRRGELTKFPDIGGQLLIAPLLAVERGHNIVIPGGKAAIGSVYFLARPHHRPDDITLATQAINDWAVRQVRGPGRRFTQTALAAGSPDDAGLRFRAEAARKWHRFLTRRLSWTSLPPDEKSAFTWDQLVVIWQVIGRLVRGGVAARVYFVDGAFSPREAGFSGDDTPATSLLASMLHELAPYFDPESAQPAIDRSLVEALYDPLYRALRDMN